MIAKVFVCIAFLELVMLSLYRKVRRYIPLLDYLSLIGDSSTYASFLYVLELFCFVGALVALGFGETILLAGFCVVACLSFSFNIYHVILFWDSIIDDDEVNGQPLFFVKSICKIDILSKCMIYGLIFNGYWPLVLLGTISYMMIFIYSYFKWNY